jgi:acyl-CoA thioester hydrolase
MDRIVTIPIALRWSDQDPNGHVNNAAVVTLLEEARVRWRLAAIAEGGIDASAVAFVVVRLELDYLKSVVFGRDLTVDVGVEAVGTRSLTLTFTGNQDGTVVFRATTVVVVPGLGGRARPLTDAERAYLADLAR